MSMATQNQPSEPTAAELMAWLKTLSTQAQPVPTKQVPEIRKHPMLHPDFWFIFGGLLSSLALLTSFAIPHLTMEPLIFGSIICQLLALVTNLSRDAQTYVVHKFILKDDRPRPALLTIVRKAKATLAEIQAQHLGK